MAFDDTLDYRKYRLLNCSLRYNGKMAMGTTKLAKRIEIIMKTYRFQDSDPVTILSFMGQCKKACDSNRVSESAAMWPQPFFMTKSPATSLTSRLTLRKDVDVPAIVFRGKEE